MLNMENSYAVLLQSYYARVSTRKGQSRACAAHQKIELFPGRSRGARFSCHCVQVNTNAMHQHSIARCRRGQGLSGSGGSPC